MRYLSQQIEHNLNFDFSLTGEDGKAFQPVFGPGLTGLRNLGNSCYMASVLQAIFTIDKFKERYLIPAQLHSLMCPNPDPSQCLDCQMHKIADGLLSGRYSHPRSNPDPAAVPVFPSQAHNPQPAEPPLEFQEGIKPTMFKALIGKGHEEFSTMRQQDSEEFFGWLLKGLRQNAKKNGVDPLTEPTEVFRFGFEQRLQCGECKRVRYRVDSQDTVSVPVPATEKPKVQGEDKTEYEPVDLLACLEMLTGVEALEYKCPSCNKNVIAQKYVGLV
jgi:ubiquitin carboxyl-terminal hydrolase 5/13